MKHELPRPLGFWSTVRVLLRAARQRAAGRRKRQRELLRARSGRKGVDWGKLGFALTVLFMVALNVLAAFVLRMGVTAGERVEAARQGKIVVSRYFLNAVKSAQASARGIGPAMDFWLDPTASYSSEASRIAERYGGKEATIEQQLRYAAHTFGVGGFITEAQAAPGFAAFSTMGIFPGMVGSIVLIWWAVMLVFQGEGLELDLQRRRHPMWEWLFSHPVSSGAIFLAEMLSPIAANPIYWGAPLFVGVIYGFVYGAGAGFLATFLIGVPVAIAVACLGKAFEVAVTLRFPARSRGAMVGFMSWLGYTSMMLFFAGIAFVPKVVVAVWKFLDLFTVLPWPWLKLFLGARSDGAFSFLLGMLACWVFAAVVTAGAIQFSVWGARQGLAGNLGRADSRPTHARSAGSRFGKDPLYRKEFLWFIRDRSALVQTILIPLTIAGYEVFNLRGILVHAQGAWNYLCGAGILFGTYFLWVLGPKSLSSEGTALWIALTWPRGLESLLKAKAWLWSLISCGMVGLVLCYAAFLFTDDLWKIALVGIGWFLFSRSMAEKTVTLVTVPSSSGEQQKVPAGRMWAAQLGMLTFTIGILGQQWHIAIMGIVYSYLTAAAMWENFRARLPYLYDPWSERLPPPPTLMHAMIAISLLVEGGAVVTGILLAAYGRENIAVAQAVAYGICAVLVSIGMGNFLGNRGVSRREVWRWLSPAIAQTETQPQEAPRSGPLLRFLLLGATGGVVLGLFAIGYTMLLQHLPITAEFMRKSQEQMAKLPNLRSSYAVMSIGFAPYAEEYLFRGLLFRALDREWGGWRAVIGSAAFFAIYHPPFAWLPVFLLGVSNALLFKKTGWLAPAVVLHMVYNAVVLP